MTFLNRLERQNSLRLIYIPSAKGIDAMTLQDQSELEATREKLRMLEQCYDATSHDPGGDEHARELSRRSLKRLINQLIEEIVRFESRGAIGKCL
jgi:hypothetical protein